MRYRFVDQNKHRYPVRVLCRVLQVSHSGYYAWRGRAESERSRTNRRLLVEIRAIHRASRRTYGSIRIKRELLKKGLTCSRNRVARLMRLHGIRAKQARKYKLTTDSNHTRPVAQNVLDRNFRTDHPNRVWVSDISYIRTRQGWLYLAVVLDLFSRRVVGWSMQSTADRELVLTALEMALRRRRPAGGLLHHSDRGSQYASKDYGKLLEKHGAVPSMSRKGDCWDNAVAESFLRTLKVECVYDYNFRTRREAKDVIFDYIESFYNTKRLHSTLDYVSPDEYENNYYLNQVSTKTG